MECPFYKKKGMYKIVKIENNPSKRKLYDWGFGPGKEIEVVEPVNKIFHARVKVMGVIYGLGKETLENIIVENES
jgi:Fe2+ transport system protein FeoA